MTHKVCKDWATNNEEVKHPADSSSSKCKRTHHLLLCVLDSRWQPILGLMGQSSGRHPVTPPLPLSPPQKKKTPNTTQQAQELLGGRLHSNEIVCVNPGLSALNRSLFPLLRNVSRSPFGFGLQMFTFWEKISATTILKEKKSLNFYKIEGNVFFQYF